MQHAGLYIHVPFCAKRCPYCAFVLVESDGSLHARFLAAVERHMDRAAAEFGRVPYVSLYFGGGTPSMLEPPDVARLVDAARGRFDPAGHIEATLEANPDGLGLERLAGYREAGVNRLSLGLQSVRDEELAFLGRTHDARQAIEAFHTARAAGFRNVSVDLIFGLPDQTVDRWRATLESVLALGPEHVSLYGLTIEKGTEFQRRGVPAADEDQKPLYDLAMRTLPREGWRQYEISNFARPGFESRHNSGYWEGRPYLGFGPGAHSYVPHRRWANVSNVRLYIERAEQAGGLVGMAEELTVPQRMLERAFLGLRRAEGIFAPAWEDEFGEPITGRFGAAIEECRGLGLLEWRGGFLALTPSGRMVADSVVAKFA